jgi:HAD superfamily hydrolase (TIGR01484 family)
VSVRGFAQQIGLSEPLICTNGAHILGSPTGPVWRYVTIEPDLAGRLAAMADERGWHLLTTVDETTYRRQAAGEPQDSRVGHASVRTNREALSHGMPSRVLSYELAAMPAIRALCSGPFSSCCHLETYFRPDGSVKSLGVFGIGADKGTALDLVLGRLGIARERVMAIGDNPNDLPMFRLAGWRVAMGNATEDVLSAADAIAPHNDANGVAWAVDRYVLSA